MIPDIAVLRRRPLGSGLSDATYDPRLMLTRTGRFGSKGGELFEETFEYNASLVHEWTHWFQHHATTAGVFLNTLRYSQQMTTARWFRGWPKEKVRTLLEKRNRSQRAVLTFDPSSEDPIFEHTTDSDLGMFQQIWFDHQWVHGAFGADIAQTRSGVPSPRVYGEVMADVILAFEEGGFPLGIKAETEEQRVWYSFIGGTTYVAIEGVPITTRTIMETAATVAELELLPQSLWSAMLQKGGNIQWQHRIKLLLEGAYGGPFRLFLNLSETSAPLSRILSTLSAVCFAALNPPLPPFVIRPPSRGDSYAWADVYPPLRFARIASVIGRVGILDGEISSKTLAQYLHTLCDAAGLEPILDFEFPVQKKGGIDFGDKTTDFENRTTGSFHDYAYWVESELNRDRFTRLPLFAALGRCFSGEESRRKIHALLGDIGGETIPRFRCPLHWTENDKIGFLCRSDFGNWLLRSTLLHEALFDVVVGTGKFDFSGLPPM